MSHTHQFSITAPAMPIQGLKVPSEICQNYRRVVNIGLVLLANVLTALSVYRAFEFFHGVKI